MLSNTESEYFPANQIKSFMKFVQSKLKIKNQQNHL